MELQQLRQFIVIATAENLTRASEVLFVSQPALTYSLKKLEAELGTQLFTRTKNRIILNEEGRKALELARRVVTAADEMLAAFADGEKQTRLTIYSSSVAAVRYIIPMFLSEHPEVTVNTVDMLPDGLADALLSGKCDLAFSNELLKGEGIRNMPFCRDDLQAWIPEGHPLYERDAVYMRDLAGSYTLHHRDQGNLMSDRIMELLQREAKDFHPTMINDYQIYRSTAKFSRKYVSFLSALGIPYYEEVPYRRFVRILDPEVRMTVYICYLTENAHTLEVFFRWIRENYTRILR